MSIYKLKNHTDSILPDGKQWKLVWNDEFDGETLDESKWSYRFHIMGTRMESWDDENAKLDGKGNLILSVTEKDGIYHTSQLQTGENYMDRPGTKFEKYTWPIAAISEPEYDIKLNRGLTDIMNVDVRCRKGPAGGLPSGCSPRFRVAQRTRPLQELRLILWNPLTRIEFHIICIGTV